MMAPVWVSGTELVARAMPKSVIFTSPSGVTRMLPGFTSRWTTPASCAACRPSAACPTMSQGAVRVRAGPRG